MLQQLDSKIRAMQLYQPRTKLIFVISLLLIVVMAIYFGLNQESSGQKKESTNLANKNPLEKKSLKVGEKLLVVEIADSSNELQQGLSKRTALDPDTGMYFNLGEKKVTTFWMKEMMFSIDIIWIDNATIVGIEKNAAMPGMGDIPTFTSPVAVTNVLEVNAGFCEENNIQVGDKIIFE